MSTLVPKLTIIPYSDTDERFRILLHPFSDPLCWDVFYGFDRPQLLIEQYEYLQDSRKTTFLLREWYVRRRARRFMRENDDFFEDDIVATEAWLRTYEPVFVEYMAQLPTFTHMSWVVSNITVCVHAINYALSFHNDTVIIGIRPPEVLDDEYRIMLMLHELAHMNLRELPFELGLDNSLIVPAGEVLALYASYVYAVTTHAQQPSSLVRLILNECLRQNLTEQDLELLHKRMQKTTSLDEVKEVMRDDAVVEILERYRPVERAAHEMP